MHISKIVKFCEEAMKVTAFLLFIFGALFYLVPPFERFVFNLTGPFEYYYLGRFSINETEGNIVTQHWSGQISPALSRWSTDNGFDSMIEGAFSLEGSVIYNASRTTSMNGRSDMTPESTIRRMAGIDQCLLIKNVALILYQDISGSARRIKNNDADIVIQKNNFGSEYDDLSSCYINNLNCFVDPQQEQIESAASRMAVWARAVQVSC